MNISLSTVSKYPDSQAVCPICDSFVKCHQLEYVKLGRHVHKTKLLHRECNTVWEIDFVSNTSKVLTQEVTR